MLQPSLLDVLGYHSTEETQVVGQHSLVSGEQALLDACFRLRYGYFVERRGWVRANPQEPGLERDRYDDHCLHLAARDEQGVAAYLRVLPFDPFVGFMLDRELSCLVSQEERKALPREGAVELSRLVVRPDVASWRDDGRVHPVEEVFKALYRASKEHGFARFYVVVEQGWLRPFARRFGVPFRVLGTPHVFPDGTKTVAGWRHWRSSRPECRATAPPDTPGIRKTSRAPSPRRGERDPLPGEEPLRRLLLPGTAGWMRRGAATS